VNFHQKHLTHYQNKIAAIKFRETEASLLLPKGNGVELGALYWPTPLTQDHNILYSDIRTRDESLKFYNDKAPPVEQSPGMIDIDFKIGLNDFCIDCPKELDFFISNHCIEHVPLPQIFLKAVEIVLRPGGVAMITVPDAQKIYDRPRARTRVTDFYGSIDSKRLEYIYHVEGIKNFNKAYIRLQEIKENGEDPHLWTFDLSTIQSVLIDTFNYFDIKLKIKTLRYNQHFEEINVFLEKI
jgi:SAM-dependent methyltransferase